MAYLETRSTNRQFGTLLAVGSLQLALGFALVTGLATSFVPFKDEVIIGIPIPKDLPPPPKPPKQQERKADLPRPTPQPQPQNPFTDLGPTPLPTFGPEVGTGDTEGGLGEVEFPRATPTPEPRFAPKIARPRGNPANWVSERDYPSEAIHREQEGLVRVRLAIGSDGRVQDCTVTSSSEVPSLDRVTCEKLSARGRFEPASDSDGARVAGSWSGSIRWVLPE